MKHFVGVDISKEHFHFCILNEDRKTLRSGNHPMSSEGFSQFLELLNSLSEPVVVMESSGRFHIPLYNFLLSNNINVYILNPKVVQRFFKFISANNPSKADKKDAKILALFALSNPHLLSKCSANSNLRNLARLIKKLTQELAVCKTQIKYALSVLFPEAERHFNVFSHTFLNILLKYPSAKHLKEAKCGDIARVIKNSHTRGRKTSLQPDILIQVAKNSIGVDDPYFTEVLLFYIEKLLFLKPKIQRLTKMLIEQINKQQHEQMKFISSIKGISEKLTAMFLAEVKDVKNFSNHKKLIKYAGTDPVIKQSGKYMLRMSISKQGSASLRSTLFQMAAGVVKWNPYFREYFLRKSKQFGSYKKAMIALVNKLVRVIYAVCIKAEPFTPQLVKPISAAEVSHV